MVFKYFRERRLKKEARKAYLDSLKTNKGRLSKGPAQIITQSYSALPKPTIEILALKLGRVYFIEEEKYDLTSKIVRDRLGFEAQVLWIDRINPEHIKQDYNLKSPNLEMIWMRDPIRDADKDKVMLNNNVIPVSLEHILRESRKFLSLKDGIFVLGSLHDLIENKGFGEVKRFVDKIADDFASYKGFIQALIPVNPETIDPTYLAKLKQNREVIKYNK